MLKLAFFIVPILVSVTVLLVLIFKTRNVQEKIFVCPHEYETKLGVSQLTMVTTIDKYSGLKVVRNAFWFLGLKDDFETMQQVKESACYDDTVPVIVFSMYPSQGLDLDVEASHYMPDERIGTWEEYDEKLEYYAEHLSEIPSIIVMEPSLLMHTFNSKTEYHNTEYQLAFANRVDRVIQLFKRSWVYVDAGNAMYLEWAVNLEHIIYVLKRMPVHIRGFSLNVGSFVNSTFNRQLAEGIHCQTGLHYIVDTSRNGGDFSKRTIDAIYECTYDPPNVEKGENPSWQTGATNNVLSSQILANSETENTDLTALDGGGYEAHENIGKKRRKRWVLVQPNDGTGPIYEADNPAAGAQGGGSGGGGGGGGGGDGVPSYGDSSYYDYYYGTEYPLSRACIAPEGQEGLDAFLWVKTPGESDGRLFAAGTYHPCLLGHNIECSESCPQYVPKHRGEFQRPDSCKCPNEN